MDLARIKIISSRAIVTLIIILYCMMMWRDRRGDGKDERRKEGEGKERGLQEA
jgi:hypothetical protein